MRAIRVTCLLAAVLMTAGLNSPVVANSEGDEAELEGLLEAVDLEATPPTITLLGMTIDVGGAEIDSVFEDADGEAVLVVGWPVFVLVERDETTGDLMALEVVQESAASISGIVQDVDVSAQTITVLGMVIDVGQALIEIEEADYEDEDDEEEGDDEEEDDGDDEEEDDGEDEQGDGEEDDEEGNDGEEEGEGDGEEDSDCDEEGGDEEDEEDEGHGGEDDGEEGEDDEGEEDDGEGEEDDGEGEEDDGEGEEDDDEENDEDEGDESDDEDAISEIGDLRVGKPVHVTLDPQKLPERVAVYVWQSLCSEELEEEELDMALSANFSRSGKDRARVSGRLGLPATFTPQNVPGWLSIGGAEVRFTLDRKGRARFSNGKFKVRKKRNQWTFRACLKNGSFARNWVDEGIVNSTVTNTQLTMPVSLRLGAHSASGSCTLTYRARAGKAGKAVRPRR